MAEIFYHYTDGNAALNIINNRELHLTNTKFLNDLKEGKKLREYLNDLNINSYLTAILDYIDSNVDSYTVSFSKQKDKLSQWRGYCPTGEGYSIGFSQPKSFTTLQHTGQVTIRSTRDKKSYVKQINVKNDDGEDTVENKTIEEDSYVLTNQLDSFVACIYEPEEQKEIAADIYQNLKSEIEKLTTGEKESFLNLKSSDIKGRVNMVRRMPTLMNYILYSLIFKDKSFEEEEEYRFIIFFWEGYKQDPCYKNRTGIFVPYFRYVFDYSHINSIVVRDSNPMAQTNIGLDHLLKFKEEASHIKVENSKIPFRL